MESNLLVASSRAPQLSIVTSSIATSCVIFAYNYETATLDDILVGIHQLLQGQKINSIGFLLHSLESEMFLCFANGRVVSDTTVADDSTIRSFFKHIVQSYVTPGGGRLDFLNACLKPQSAQTVVSHLETLLSVPVGIWKDYFGDDGEIGKIYFKALVLKKRMEEIVSAEEKLDGYEKIKTVGKGAFGTAVLYRETSTDNLVVIKEINMIELTAGERQMALNEAQVLSILNHPNIVRYRRSFERDGILMIEMEYAEGGTLAQLLPRQSRPLPERDILTMFYQIVAAIRHMHEHNILHRDLKTANVFLTKDNVVKVGDFGISKAMTTRAQAQTVLGTPYYISPEMCEGKQYDQKSDIWAVGCIIYEMACLKKAFQGSSLPALVNNIMKGNFQPVSTTFSPAFRQMVIQLLQREPQLRPSAVELLNQVIPRVVDLLSIQNKDGSYSDHHDSLSSMGKNSRERSVLYELTGFGPSFSLTPLQLPAQIKIKQVAVSNTHYVILTSEATVLTWGEGTKGQLGQGDTPSWRAFPGPVSSLGDRSVRMVGAGDGFSVFVSDSGMLMTCGDGSFGCLGHSDWNNLSKPKLIEKLLQVDVTAMSCGPRHVAVLSADGEMHTWGQGDGGRLGLGHERDISTPSFVTLPETVVLQQVHCGVDGTMAITANGSLLACGRNNYNKLGLSESKFFPPGQQVLEKSLTFRRVASVKPAIIEVSLGPTHSCLLTENGRVITMGRHQENQLGHQNSTPTQVSATKDIMVTSVKAGPSYSVISSVENAIFLWGTRYFHRPSTSTFTKQSSSHNQILNASNLSSRVEEEINKEPKEILALYASPQQTTKGNTIYLGGIFPMPASILILVHTTLPLPKRPQDSASKSMIPEIDNMDGDTDSLGPIPEWIKSEVADSQASWDGYTSSSNPAFDYN